MSHFSLAVFTEKGQTVDELLEPFDENLVVDEYISKTKEQIIEKEKQWKKKILNRIKEDRNYKLTSWEKEILECITDEDFYLSGVHKDSKYDENGNELSTYNPNSKWDYYLIGGRWNNLLKNKSGKNINSCLVSDLDLSINEEEYKKSIRFWELIVEEKPLKEGEVNPRNPFKKEYYIERYETKENFAIQCNTLPIYAVLTPDGEWYEPGQMGWFGFSSAGLEEEKKWDKMRRKLLKEANKDWTITIVDCHI